MKVLIYLLSTLLVFFSLSSCDDNDDKNKVVEVKATIWYKHVDYAIVPGNTITKGIKIKEDNSDEWVSLAGIDGFNYEEGYNYEVRLQKTFLSNPPQDGSSIEYRLIEIIEKTKFEPEMLKYVYTGKHEIDDFNVFVGPEGRKIPFDAANASHFWGKHSLLGEPYYDTLIFDLKNDTLYKISEHTNLSELLVQSGDTLKTEYNSTEFYGIFVDDSTFIMNRAHYYIYYDGRETDWNPYSEVNHYGYWRNHEKAREDEFFHENTNFRDFKDMTLPTDTIAWLTEYYEFKLTEAY